MDFELSQAKKRFEKEAAKRKQADKARLERQRRDRELAERKRVEFEAAAAAERAAAAEAAEKLRLKHDALLEKNKGVWSSQTLVPQLNLTAEAKGIRRRADKISLPRSFGEALTPQHDASKHGPMCFELALGTKLTHATLLDFEAPEGVVGLPPQVLRCLGLPEGGVRGAGAAEGAPAVAAGAQDDAAVPGVRVTVTYRTLRPGTYAKLQPVTAGFQRDVGDIKSALEEELHTHATLSEGDTVVVRSLEDGSAHELRVVSLMPEPAVSVIDTDLEVDIAPSVEAEAAQAAELARKAREAELAQHAEAERQRREAEETASRAALLEAAAEAREAAVRALAPEPDDGEGVVTVMVKLPTGGRATRRFERAEPLEHIFQFVDTLELGEAAALAAHGYRLASQFPRRVWERPPSAMAVDGDGAGAGAVLTLEAAGLASKQEALFVELAG